MAKELGWGFNYQLKVCQIAKKIQEIDPQMVNISNLIDAIYKPEKLKGDERDNAAQRLRMFLSGQVKKGNIKKMGEGRNVIYWFDFEKIKI